MSEFIVHSIPGSPFGRAVLATLEEKGARYRLAPVAPGTMRSPEHLARHPFGRVPVLEHDGFRALRNPGDPALSRPRAAEPSLTPADPQARRADGPGDECQRLVSVSGRRQRHHLSSRGRTALDGAASPTRRRSKPRCRRRARCSRNWRGCSASNLFRRRGVSLADLLLAPAVAFFTGTPEWTELGAPHANLAAWLARMEARPSMQATTWERVSEMAKAA